MTKLWKIWQVALELQVPVSTVEAWVKENKVAIIRTGPNTTRIPQAEVERLIARSTVPVRPAARGSSPCLNERDG